METAVIEQGQEKQKIFDRMNKGYDRWVSSDFVSSYYQNSGYMSWGYWSDKTHNVKEACDNMVDTLLNYIDHKDGNILEVACGAGGVTKRLLNYYDPSDVTAINISQFQLQEANKNAPGCNFLLMDATDLKFQDAAFNNLICVEAAFHFNTREKFLQEAYRVLKPGGKVVLSDILAPMPKSKRLRKRMVGAIDHDGTANYVNLEEYRNLCLKTGFKDIVISDITKDTLPKYISSMFRSIPRYANGSAGKYIGAFFYCLGFYLHFKVRLPIDHYLLVSLTK